jgi:ATP-dependent helicase/nuclease subunit B
VRGWYSIPAHRPFLADLAAGLTAVYGDDPEALADAVILLPNRRGARDLAEAMLAGDAGRRAVLMPRIRALGELEAGEPPFEPADIALDLDPAIDPMRRRFELARMAAAHWSERDESLTPRGALAMADALGAFLDGLQVEERSDPDALDTLAPEDQALHWAKSAGLLKRVMIDWPKRLAALGLMDAAERRIQVLNRLAEQWDAHPPAAPVIAAGSNEAAPAVSRLLGVIARAPQGAVVLPGLDEGLADDAWSAVGEAHPQGALKALLTLNMVARGEVQEWPASRAAGDALRGRSRRRVINEALRPAEATADWLNVLERMRAGQSPDPVETGLNGLSVIAAAQEEEAATVCAVLMREALETPGLTCALVTPDQALARRVEARLSRWGLTVDDSAGVPLSRSSQGRLVALAARQVAEPLEPISLLSLIKHPAVRAHPRAVRGLEDAAFRGPRPRSWSEVQARIEAARGPDHRDIVRPRWRLARLDAARDLAARLEAVLPQETSDASADVMAARLAEIVEALAGERAWVGPEGEAAARIVAGLVEHGAALPTLSAVAFADLVQTLLDDQTVRVDRPSHPRLRILGAIEARLVRADRMILAGLEEGVWPRAAQADPFLSRPMRKALGLPAPERRLGLAAHDFAQAASAGEVYLVHAERRDGQPSVRSRWLWRLATLARGAGLDLPTRTDVLDWARALDAGGRFDPAQRPRPAPPLEARPTRWSVTDAETLTRDPYAIWARKIVRLEQRAPPNEAVDARLRGTAIHAAFEAFSEAINRGEPADPSVFERLYLDALKAGGLDETGLAREAALAASTAGAAADFETERRADGRQVIVEQRGELAFPVGERQHRLSARADRIEVRDGGVHVLDFKTGAPPGKKEVEIGFAPQLTLTGALAARGAFQDGQALTPRGLTYVRVSGRKPPIVVTEALGEDFDPAEMSEQAWEGFLALLESYENHAEPYRSRLAPKYIKRAGDYAHLARVFEWTTAGDGSGEAGGGE